MLPYEEVSIVTRTIEENLDKSDEDIINLMGRAYYNVYKYDIDNMLDKYRGRSHLNHATVNLNKDRVVGNNLTTYEIARHEYWTA